MEVKEGDCGRYNVSSTERKGGSLIHKEMPVAYVVYNNIVTECCSACYTRRSGLKKCTKCNLVYYCDRECQKNDWNLHKDG